MDKIPFYRNKCGDVRFYIVVNEVADHYVDVSVFEVNSWSGDADDTYIDEGELHLTASVKWDGCSHINIANEGYMHLCGREYWVEHGEMMLALYDTVKVMIKNYDPKVGE